MKCRATAWNLFKKTSWEDFVGRLRGKTSWSLYNDAKKIPEIVDDYLSIDRPVSELIEYLQRVVEKYPDAYIDEVKDVCSDVSYYAICRMRPESSEEERLRLAVEARRIEIHEKTERAEFERLKKKFSESAG